MKRPISIGMMLCAALLAGCRTANEPAPPIRAGPADRPAALFAGTLGGLGVLTGGCDYEFAGRLARDGFEVNSRARGLDDEALTWEEVKPYNVLVLAGLGLSNADGTLSDRNKQTLEVIRRFLQAGGGVLVVPSWMQMDRLIPPQVELLKPLGLTPLFEEMVFDRDTVRATAWKIDFAYSAEVRPSPVTTNVSGLWLPVNTRAGMEAHLVPFAADRSWDLVLTGSPSSYTLTVPTTRQAPTAEMTNGRFASRVPLVATRRVGPGRIVVSAINPAWLWGRWAGLTLEGVTLDQGLRGTPSQGYELVLNSLRWLAGPAGNLGGAKTSPAQLENPFVTKFAAPSDWSQLAGAPFPREETVWPGVIGARSVWSGGQGTVEAWVAKAKSLGLGYLVFLEEFAALPEEKFDRLKAECARLTTADFAAIPGFRIRDEVGNHYFYAGPSLLYPPRELLSDDGTVFIGYDPEISPNDPRAAKGQLSMTTLIYAYQFGGFKLLAGNYFFQRDASPVANWFGNFQAVGVVTRRDGKVVEDATQEYLQIADAGQGPLPVAVDLLEDPAQLAATPWRTVLRMRAGEPIIAGALDGANPVAAYFTQWNFYPDNPTRIYATEGPQIDYWSFVGPRDYEDNNRGDFVWQNHRWRVGGRVLSETGLSEVAVYDGTNLFRRFLPEGAKEFAFELDLTHDRQHNLVLIATDAAGRRAIGHEQWDRNHRLQEVNCSDRNNQLSYGFKVRPKDDTMVQLGGNQPSATPNKRIIERRISPSGAFKNDPFLGAPAFDGAAGGEPEVHAPVIAHAGAEVYAPTVGEARRLMTSGDVNIGEGICEYRFADGVGTYNVWHSLWKPEPSRDLVVAQRNHFFQVDPESPLAVFLWRVRIALRDDLPEGRMTVGFLETREARLWAVRGSDGAALSGNNEETAQSDPRQLSLPFGSGAYAAALDSPLGGAAVFPLTEGMTAQWATPLNTRINFILPADAAPRRKGDSREVELLLVGIPRSTKYTRMLGARTTEVVEQFRRDFGLGGAEPGYRVVPAAGTPVSLRYPLRVDGDFSGVIEGDLISSLPVVVGGLNDRWSAFLYDRQLNAARPLGVFENEAWATVPVRGKQDLFIGHPVTCDNRDVFLQLTQAGEREWKLEAHNPTPDRVRVAVRSNPFWTSFVFEEELDLAGGSSVFRSIGPAP